MKTAILVLQNFETRTNEYSLLCKPPAIKRGIFQFRQSIARILRIPATISLIWWITHTMLSQMGTQVHRNSAFFAPKIVCAMPKKASSNFSMNRKSFINVEALWHPLAISFARPSTQSLFDLGGECDLDSTCPTCKIADGYQPTNSILGFPSNFAEHCNFQTCRGIHALTQTYSANLLRGNSRQTRFRSGVEFVLC